jgi:CheY-like chemotaxis protein/HPt (histidine-containing phosphotransfer) domain-containing protein
LVAEDNLVNQKVALLLLEKLGYKADVAANGLKVLEALTRTRYALVLMDVQMPEMDGFEATAEIRKREGTQHHTPIIAMTANAMIGEREKCLQAGMDDYLAKPVNVDALAAVVDRWLANVPPSARANPSIDAVPGAADAVDPQVLASLRELQPAGEPDVVLELIGIFLHEVPRRLSGLQESIAQRDCRRIEELAHSLKGSCGNLGARTMAALCGSLEKEGEKGLLGDTGLLLAQVQAEFVRVRAVLEREAEGLVALGGSGELQHHV